MHWYINTLEIKLRQTYNEIYFIVNTKDNNHTRTWNSYMLGWTFASIICFCRTCSCKICVLEAWYSTVRQEFISSIHPFELTGGESCPRLHHIQLCPHLQNLSIALQTLHYPIETNMLGWNLDRKLTERCGFSSFLWALRLFDLTIQCPCWSETFQSC